VRTLAPVLVAAPPSGARIRTRLRVNADDEQVLRVVGQDLGRLAGQDLNRCCRLGRGPDQRADRKRALTPSSSSRWAGTITRTSGDQWARAYANLLDARTGLRRAVKRLRARLAVPVGQARGHGRSRVWGYHSQAERFQKQRRLQQLGSRLGEVEGRLVAGRVSVCRGGRRLAKLRHAVAGDAVVGDGGRGKDRSATQVTKAQWRERWEAERLFLTADGEADKAWGNETIRVHPEKQWLELRLPSPLAHLSNTPGRAATYRLPCPVVFTHRGHEWAAQAASGAVRYDLFLDPAKGRWYVAASWRLPTRQVPSLEELRQDRAVAVDLNAGHLDAWVLDPSGNPASRPRSPWTLPGCRPAPATAGCGQRLPPSSGSPGRVAAGRSWSRIWTSPTPVRPAVRPAAAVLAARPSAARWRAYRPERSGICWWAWPPTPTCGWWRWIPAGPRSGASATGKRRSPRRRRPRSPCRAITRRQW
jgi:hypothetical protein